jgi:hypothetical protein
MPSKHEYLATTYEFDTLLDSIRNNIYSKSESIEYLMAFFEHLSKPNQLTDDAIFKFFPRDRKVTCVYPDGSIQLEGGIIIQPTASAIFNERLPKVGNSLGRVTQDRVTVEFYNTTDSVRVELMPSTIIYLNLLAASEAWMQ